MTAAPLGLPQRPHTPAKVTTYQYVPTLKDLLRTAGVSGVGYLQACLHNLRLVLADRAADWAQAGGVGVYTIKGPKGEAEVMLLCVGSPIKGQDPHSGARICWYDEDIGKATGYETDKDYTVALRGVTADKLFGASATHPSTEGLPGTPLAQVVAAQEAGDADEIAAVGVD